MAVLYLLVLHIAFPPLSCLLIPLVNLVLICFFVLRADGSLIVSSCGVRRL